MDVADADHPDKLAIVYDRDAPQVLEPHSGAGVKWIGELSKLDHKLKGLFDSVKDRITGACQFCARAFNVAGGVQECGVALLGEYDGHPSFKNLISQGYQVITL